MKQSELRVLYLWGSQDKAGKQLPLPCTDCNKWYLRLYHHLKSGKHAGLTAEERIERLELARIKHWNSVGRTRQSKYASNMEGKLPDTIEEITNYNEDDDNDIPKFVRRAKNSTVVQPLVSSVGYCPPKAKHMTEELRRTWHLDCRDNFRLYYENTENLLEGICDDLRNKGLKKNQVTQYSNQMHFIWESLDSSLQLYQKSAFSNNYALQDLYHRSTFNRVGKDGVEASTMRARYTSLGYYIAFLRKRHVYAGLSRADLTNLSENMNVLN